MRYRHHVKDITKEIPYQQKVDAIITSLRWRVSKNSNKVLKVDLAGVLP